jgi:flagellar protein FlbT
MALRFDLGPFDELHIGKCVIKNSRERERAIFAVNGEAPILRGKDVLSPALAVTALEKLYCCVQRMYLEEAHEELQESYLALAGSLKEDPSLYAELHAADQLISNRKYYQALKGLKRLIREEAFVVHRSPPDQYGPRYDLGPFDELHVGKCVIQNSHERTLFVVNGEVPILNGKDALSSALAVSALEKLYCCVQRMYLEEVHEELQGSYLALAAGSLKEDPSLYAELHAADQLISNRKYYQALKGLKGLIGEDAFVVHRNPSDRYVPRYGGRKL